MGDHTVITHRFLLAVQVVVGTAGFLTNMTLVIIDKIEHTQRFLPVIGILAVLGVINGVAILSRLPRNRR